MPMLIYQLFHATQTEFIEFWRGVYYDPTETLYSNNIGQALTEQRILDLFKWKNGGPLAQRKEESVRQNFVEHLGDLQQLQQDQSIEELLALFPNGGAIFRIFWLHCWCPHHFPIYDQHVHRAMAFIQMGEPEEIPPNDDAKVASYINDYVPFHQTFDGIDIQPVYPALDRTVDKALWAFGRFLKRNPTFPVVA
jgi:hypothetical protein